LSSEIAIFIPFIAVVLDWVGTPAGEGRERLRALNRKGFCNLLYKFLIN